jgi:HK97 family phage prohead protease
MNEKRELPADVKDAPSELVTAYENRKVVEEGGKWYVKSEDGSKTLGGPYDTEEEAKKRLAEIEYFKNKDEKHWNPNREIRCLMAGLQLRSQPDPTHSPGLVVGYAAVFDRLSQDLGTFKEKVQKGAFRDVLGQDVRALANHDPTQLLGRVQSGTLKMEEDDIGLRVEINLPDTTVGRDVATSIKRGDMDGMSFSFDCDGDAWDYSMEPPERTITRVRNLYDVGPVTYPAYTDTTAAMRSLDRHRLPAPAIVSRSNLSTARARQELAEAELWEPRP